MEDDCPGRMLQQATLYDNVDLIQSLLQGPETENVNCTDSYGRTSLYTSVTNNSFECAHLLLQAGADPNVRCGTQCGSMTPLHVAASQNKHKFVSLLMDYGADPDIKNADGETALGLANHNMNEECSIVLSERIARRKVEKEKVEQGFVQNVLDGNIEEAEDLSTKISEEVLGRLINSCPHGQNSLLFRACENGHLGMVEFLLSKGALVRVHPVTGYSPLHAACHTGNVQCAKAVLQHFPELIGAPTIEGTFPLHMACAEGQTKIIQLLLTFPYPDLVQKLYKETLGNCMYRLGLSVNSRDGHGRTPLHVAAMNNSVEVVRLLLKFKVPVIRKYNEGNIERLQDDGNKGSRQSDPKSGENSNVHLDGIQTMPRVHQRLPKEEMCPIDVDTLDLDGNTPLHIAVKGNGKLGFHKVALLLLQHKANPNKPFITPMGNSDPLTEACHAGDVDMMTLLLKYGARDTNLKVLKVALKARNWDMVGAIVQYRSHMDSEYTINIPALLQVYTAMEGEEKMNERLADCMTTSKIFRTVWPQKAIVINWHSLNLPQLEVDWLYKACWQLTGPLPSDVDPRLTLLAVTRMELSNNILKILPPEIFEMPSLKILNASWNHIEEIAFDKDIELSVNTAVPKEASGSMNVFDFSSSSASSSAKNAWTCSVLEEIDLQHNRLRSIPTCLFQLPNLIKVNLSHNVLECLPFSMWSCPKLVEINLTNNNLSVLPIDMNNCSRGIPISGTSPVRVAGSPVNCDSLGESPTPIATSYPTLLASSPLTTRSSPQITDEPAKPPSSLPLTGTSYYDSPDSVSKPQPPYQQLPVNYVNQWAGKIRIHSTADADSKTSSMDNQSKLNEINLANNSFTSVPLGLSCLAPYLNKLNLSYNKLTQIGPIEAFPANLKWLDLSHNEIMSDSLFEYDPTASIEMCVMGTSTSKTCFNPSSLTKPLKSTPRGSTSKSTKLGNHSSTSSIQSLVSNSLGATIACLHRSHRQLEKLKTLRLSNNKLSKLVLTVQEKEEELLSSGEESHSQSSQSSAASSTRRDSKLSEALLDEVKELLYPCVSLLDISHNCLTSINPDIRLLSHLAELKVSGNRLKELPSELGLLKKLWNLDFSGCPIEKNLQALLGEKAKKTSTVLSYLKSIKEEATLYNRMKLMFVGIQGIGKTSLLSQLRREGKATNYSFKNWAQRMGHVTSKDKDLKGENISTVGVDIGDLVMQRGNKEVVFSTWDFGGQREYYATHQYFLSKRSLYLVLWRVTDGEDGLQQILQWLVNIQARAPNSPVIIVGTHMDMVTKKKHLPTFISDLQHLLVEKYLSQTEPEKSGLPRIIGHIEVSCKSRLMYNNHIADLVNMIWDAAWDEQLPGNKGAKLLEQKVPSTYVHLQEVVMVLAKERKEEGKDPVLHAEQYKLLVIQKMEELFSTSFRDVVELSQATQFLHENGVLLHYDDINLQDIYFLDPQWLCDVLASVVTIREINSLAKCGIMRTDDLKILFKNTAFKPEDIRTYIINLLSKFEVALRWDSNNLLIPSLLPSEMHMLRGYPGTDIRIPVLSRVTESSSNQVDTASDSPQGNANIPKRNSFVHQSARKQVPVPKSKSSETLANVHGSRPLSSNMGQKVKQPTFLSSSANPAVAIVRLYLMSYFPSGFWPRLITRLLGDDTFHEIAVNIYNFEKISAKHEDFHSCLVGTRPEWHSWQTGLELVFMGITLVKISQVTRDGSGDFCDYQQCSLVTKQDQDLNWQAINLQNMSILEIIIPNGTVSLASTAADGEANKTHSNDKSKPSCNISKETMTQPSSQFVAALMSKVVDHIDTLLEDWYPDLGARFIQNARGMYLITRIIPCPRCLVQQIEHQRKSLASTDSWSVLETNSPGEVASPSDQVVNDDSWTAAANAEHESLRADSCSTDKTDTSDLSPRSPPESRNRPERKDTTRRGSALQPTRSDVIYCYLAEQCLQAAQMNRIVFCIEHGNLGPYFIASAAGHVMAAHVAPDLVFQDIDAHYLVNDDTITQGRFLGRGAFGAVYAGVMVDKYSGDKVPVAVKMLQPVKPEIDNRTPSLLALYDAEKNRWNKDPMKSACEAYLNARKELNILLSLHNPNIVPLLGIALNPLSLVLSLAPGGALSEHLKEYVRAGARLVPYVVAEVVKQVASALHYLHTCQIIYRDLKSENVLVWSLPAPHAEGCHPVHIKLADYGVSRCVLQSGAKGLAGTPPFIAPEIIQHNGEESYTEKVDIFSFGMFLYELLVLKLPFEGERSAGVGGANMKGHILLGGRPHLTEKDLQYPTHFLDLMTMCWSHDPGERPSANQIIKLASRVEFSRLYNVIAFDESLEVHCTCSSPNYETQSPFVTPHDEFAPFQPMMVSRTDIWLATRSQEHMEGAMLTFTFEGHECVQAKHIPLGTTVISSLCVTEENVWAADSSAIIHVFRLSDYAQILTFPATTRPNVKVICMAFGAIERSVYVVLDNGHFILCEVDFPMIFSVNYSPVKTECPGNGKPIHCIGVITTESGSSELWCGQSAGRLSVWNLHDTQGHLKKLCHFASLVQGRDVVNLVTDRTDHSAVWTYVYPGTNVYRWNATSKAKESHLDTTQIYDCGLMESHKPKAALCQVTALACLGSQLFVGVMGGHVIIADKFQMMPLDVIEMGSTKSAPIISIIPFTSDENQDSGLDTDSDSVIGETNKSASTKKDNGYIVCLTKGYEDILGQTGIKDSSPEQIENNAIHMMCYSVH